MLHVRQDSEATGKYDDGSTTSDLDFDPSIKEEKSEDTLDTSK